MATIERIMELQSQGAPESEIIKRLRDEGVSPKDINDALSQVKIKQAVSAQEVPESTQGMEQSIMQQAPSPDQPQQQYYSEQPQQYQEYYAPQPQATFDTDTITEIAEQVVSEKFAEFKQKNGDIAAFRFQVQEKIQDIDERIKRIESMLDKIQSAIVGKFGEVAGNINYIHKDLDNMHNTVSNLMNPLIDNYNELKKLAGKK